MAEERLDVEQRVLQAARKAFFAQGVAKTPLRTIASAAGTSESGILRFFKDKNDLVCAVMDLCWGDVNDTVQAALRGGSEHSDDARFLLIQVARAVLEHAAADAQTMSFLVGHFHYALASHPEEGAPEGGKSRLEEYRRYRQTIDRLCRCVIEDHPDLAEAGITQAGLCHLTLSLIHGITGGWYMSERDPEVHGPKVALDDALAVLSCVVYRGASAPGMKKFERRQSRR